MILYWSGWREVWGVAVLGAVEAKPTNQVPGDTLLAESARYWHLVATLDTHLPRAVSIKIVLRHS